MPILNSNQKKTYIRVLISNVPSEYEESVSTFCFDYGAMGVSENLDFDKKVYPDPKIIKKDKITLEAFFENRNEEFLNALQEVYPELVLDVSEQENKDWLEEWKKGFHAFQLVDKYWIVPSWEQVSDPSIEPIFIDPGMAFGTGTHETTQICSELIHKVISENKINSLIDVGTGTGILAFVAQKMGVKDILGTDNDPEAIRVALENAEINKIELEITQNDLHLIDKKFDVVVANIIDGVLLQLKNQLLSKTISNGFYILSGIIIENDSEFIEAFLKGTNLVVQKRIQKGEWVGYLLKS